MDCPACGHANRESARFCAACGHDLAAPAPRRCGACGAACQADARFCPGCGKALATSPDPLDFSTVGLDLPADDRTVILPATPPRPSPAAAAAAVTAGADGDMTVVLPAGWRPPPATAASVRTPSEEITVIPAAPAGNAPAIAATAAAPPAPPPPPATAAPPSPPAAGGSGRGMLVAAALALMVAAGAGTWYWLSSAPPAPAPAPVADTDAALMPATAGPAATSDSGAGLVPSAALAPVPPQDIAAPPPPLTVQTASAGPRPARALYLEACARCHDRGEGGSPRVSAPDEWNGLFKRSRTVLADRVLKGHGGAPAAGGIDIDGDEARRLVAHVSQLVEQSAARLAAERAREQAAQPAPTPAPAPVAAAPAPRADDWLTSLRGELARCAQLNFFARIPCDEKARWTYCNNRWNTVPECTVRNQSNSQ